METSFSSAGKATSPVIPEDLPQLRAGVLRPPTQADEEHQEKFKQAASQSNARNGIRVLALSSTSTTLVAAGDTGDIETWDLRLNQRLHTITHAHGHGACRALDVSPDDRYIISGGVSDKRLKVWRLHLADESARVHGSSSGLQEPKDDNDTGSRSNAHDPLAAKPAGCAAMAVITWPDANDVSADPSTYYVACGGDSKADHVHIWTCSTTVATTPAATSNTNARGEESMNMTKVSSLEGTADVRCMVYDKQHGRIFAGNKKDTIDMWCEHMWAPDSTREAGESYGISPMISFVGHTGWLNALAISTDGLWLVSGSGDKTIKIWNVAPTRKPEQQRQQQQQQQRRQQQQQQQQCFATLRGHTSWVNSIVVTSDFRRIISGAWDGEIKVWIVEARECLATLTSNRTNTPALVLCPQTDRYFISGSISGAIRVWDTDLTSSVQEHRYKAKVNSVALAPDSTQLAICAGPKVFLLSINHHTLYKKDATANLQGATATKGQSTEVVVSQPNDCAAGAAQETAAGNKAIQQGQASTNLSAFEANPGAAATEQQAPPAVPRRFLEFGFDEEGGPSHRTRDEEQGSVGACGGLRTNNVKLKVRVPDKKFNSVCFSHDGNRLFAAHETGRIFVACRQAAGAGFGPLKNLAEECHQHELRAMDVSEHYLVSGDRGDSTHAPKLIAWDPVKWESVAQRSLPVGEKVNCIAIAPDETCVAVGCGEFSLRVYGLPELRQEAALIPNVGGRKVKSDEHRGRVSSVVFLSDSRRLVSGSDDNTVKVWALTTHRETEAEHDQEAPDAMPRCLTCLATFEGHTANVTSLGASPDDRYLVTASQDTTLKVWDLRFLELAHCSISLKGHSSIVWTTAVCSKGRFIVSGSQDKTVRVWPLAQLLSPNHFHGLPHLPTFTMPGIIEHDHRDPHPTHRLSTLRRAMAAFPLTLMFPMPANSSISTVSAGSDERDKTPLDNFEHDGPLAWAARNDDRLDILRVLLQTPNLPLLEMGEGGAGRMFHEAVLSPSASDLTVRVVVEQLIASARAQDEGVERPELPVYWRLSLATLDSVARSTGPKGDSAAHRGNHGFDAPVPSDTETRNLGDGMTGNRSISNGYNVGSRGLEEVAGAPLPDFTRDIIYCMADHRDVACDLLRGLGLVLASTKVPRVGSDDPYIPSEHLYILDGGNNVAEEQEGGKKRAGMGATGQSPGWITPLRYLAEQWSRHATHKKVRDARRHEQSKAQRWDMRVVPIPHASRYLLPELVKNDDVLLFNNAIARALVAFKWQRYGRAEFMRRLLIYLISLACATALVFTANLNGATAMELFTSNSGTDIVSAVLVLVLTLIALWETTYEVKQLVHDVGVYVSDIWNWVDAGNVVLVLLMAATYFGGWIHARIFLSLSVLLRWYGLLYFLQAFHTTGPLVRMIVAITYDVRYFLLVLFIAIVASWTAIHALLRGQTEEDLDSDAMQRTANGLLLTFSMLILMEFDLDALTGTYKWLLRTLFVLSMVLVPLVLLNLLIALMSDSYERIKDRADVEFQLLRAKILVEQEGFMHRQQKKNPRLFPKWLYCVVRHDHTEALIEQQVEWKGVLHDIKANTAQSVDQATLQLMQRLDDVEHAIARLPTHIAAAKK